MSVVLWEGLQSWLEQIESFFNLLQIPTEQHVNLAYHHILGVASTWSSKREELIAWWSWSEFVDALRHQFDPPISVEKPIDSMVLENNVWDGRDESEAEKDRMLMKLEAECLQEYQRKVNEVSNAKAFHHQSVPAKESELAALMDSLGEHAPHYLTPEKRSASLKKHLESLPSKVEDLRTKKEERTKQFANVKAQIEKIDGEISGSSTLSNDTSVEENDMSIRKLNEFQTRLQSLNKEKSDRFKKILESVNEVHCLCGVLGLDFGKTVSKVHPSYGSDFDEVSHNNELPASVFCSLLILRGGTWQWKSVSTTPELQGQILPPKSVPGWPLGLTVRWKMWIS